MPKSSRTEYHEPTNQYKEIRQVNSRQDPEIISFQSRMFDELMKW